jgi:hypothetical protein
MYTYTYKYTYTHIYKNMYVYIHTSLAATRLMSGTTAMPNDDDDVYLNKLFYKFITVTIKLLLHFHHLTSL